MTTIRKSNFLKKEVDTATIQSIEDGLNELEKEIEDALDTDSVLLNYLLGDISRHSISKRTKFKNIGFKINEVQREYEKQSELNKLLILDEEHNRRVEDLKEIKLHYTTLRKKTYRAKKAISLFRVFKGFVSEPLTNLINYEIAIELNRQIYYLINNGLRQRQRPTKSDLLFQVPLRMLTLRMTRVKTTGKFYTNEQFKKIIKDLSERLTKLNLSFYLNMEISLEEWGTENFLCPHFHIIFTNFSLEGDKLIEVESIPFNKIAKMFSTICEKHTGKKAEFSIPDYYAKQDDSYGRWKKGDFRQEGQLYHLRERPEELDGYVFYGQPKRVKQATKHIYWYVSKPQLLSPGDYFLTDYDEDLEDWFLNNKDEFPDIYKYHTMDKKRPPTGLGFDPYRTLAIHLKMISRIPNRKANGLLSGKVQEKYLSNLLRRKKTPEELQKVSQILYEGSKYDLNNTTKCYEIVDPDEVHNKVIGVFI
jgi:hypothetical protein